MNILGIDHGEKRFGLALLNQSVGVILPFGIIEAKNWRTDLVNLIKTEKIDQVVLGLPINLAGEETEHTKIIREFAVELNLLTSVLIEFVDERFTTHAANRMGGESSVDEKAAMLMLESYL